jgi:hypothetical protein
VQGSIGRDSALEQSTEGEIKMDHAFESTAITHGSSADNVYDPSIGVDLLDELHEEHPHATQDVEASASDDEEHGEIAGTRVSYGSADILFPMTPPKPKGARLIRGPLRFN